MKLRVIASTAVFLLAVTTLTFADDTVQNATTAAKQWLAIVDAGQYGKSWDEASTFFQGKVTKQQWEQKLDQSRKPLGKMETRQFKSGLPATNPPGAPAGKYCAIQFQTKFSVGGALVETLSMVLDKNGQWKPTAYFMKPE